MVAHGRAFWSSGSLQQAFHSLTIHRQLNGSGTGNDDNNISGHGDSDVIRSTLRLYGSVFLVVFLMFCWLRRRFPRRFNVRSWAPKVKSELANDQHGFISWMWKVWKVSDDEIREECGLDALCYLRALQLGFRLSCVGMVNSIWLLPLYSTAEESNKASQITDKIARITVGNIPPGSPRFLGTVLAAYIFFGFTMHFILIEFRWFTKHRHHFLLNFNPRNYSVYVRNIPEEYRSSGELQQLFRRIFSTEAVLQAHVALFIAGLDKKVDQRKALITKLEHAIALKNLTGISPTHSQRWLSGRSDRIDSIEAYTIELELLNADISDQVNTYARARRPKLPYSQTALASSRHLCQKEVGREKQRVPLLNHQNGSSLLNPDEVESLPQSYTREMESMGTEIGNDPLAIPDELPTIDTVNIETMNHSKSYMAALKKVFAFLISAASSKIKGAAQLSSAVATNAIRSTEGLTHSAMSMLGKDAEGRNRDAGFVTFTTLRSTHIAIQNIQHSEPFVLDIEPAPDPSEIFWDNVGRPLHQVQAGKLVSVGMTVGLCLFWTIPVSLIVSLTQVESLKDTITFLYKWVQRWPWIEELLALIAPLMLLILNSTILPLILRAICKLEYPVALSTLEASSFVKMTSFVIIQTFFVSAISGTLTAELTNILKDPESIVNFLAISLPGRSTYFLQLLIVSTFVGLSLELMRVVPLFQAAIRRRIGYNLTDKERNQSAFGMRPLSDPDKFQVARIFSADILYFMVLLVYSSLSPIVPWFLSFFLVLMGSGYRHSFLYNYPKTPDSGGEIWISFIKIFMSCMLIAQVTITGYLALKKSVVGVPLMIPLIGITALFNIFIRQRHFRISENLPASDCLNKDSENHERGVDFSEFKDKYLQPALTVTVVEPDWAHR